jgi:RNA polymerase sigma-70 factor (ECF subfamily)
MNTKHLEIFQDLREDLFNHSYRIIKNISDAEDIIQNVYFKFSKQDLDKIPVPKAWLFLVCKNDSIKLYNKRKRFVYIENNEFDEKATEDKSVVEEMQDKEIVMFLLASLKNIDARLQKVITYRFYKNLSYEAIAKKMKTTKGNICFMLNFAIKKLKKEFLDNNKKYNFL